MIVKIRNFINTKILGVDSSLKEWKDVFNSENIPESIIDDSYHVSFGAASYTRDDQWIESDLPVEISLFKKGFRQVQDAHDAIYDKAILINLNLSDIASYNSTFVRNYFPISITPEFYTSNDNLIIIKISARITTQLKSY
jgi:hypothetical protein